MAGQYTTVVMASGGPSGVYYLGALQYLLNHNLLKCDTIIGTSTGAVIGYFMAIGLHPHDIRKIVIANIQSIVPFTDKINIFKTYQHGGCFSNTRLRKCLIQTTFKYHRTLFTFRTLYEYSKINLIINAFNYTTQRTEYFSHELTPNMSVIAAVCLSSGVPILFEMQEYQKCKYLDGAIGTAFPVHYAIEDLHQDPGTVVGMRCQPGPPGGNTIFDILRNLTNRFVSNEYELMSKIYKDKVLMLNITPLKQIQGGDCVFNMNTLDSQGIYDMIDHGYEFTKAAMSEQKILCSEKHQH